MRITFKDRRTKMIFALFMLALVVMGGLILFAPGKNIRTSGASIKLWGACWSAPLALGCFRLVYLNQVRLTAPEPRAALATRLSYVLPVVVAVIAWIAFIPVARYQDRTRCDTFKPGVTLDRCDLAGVDMSNQNLQEATFYHADLRGANLSGADLSRATLTGVNLSGANLTGATLTGANLSAANLRDAVGLTDDMFASLGDWRGLVLEDRAAMAEALGAACRGEVVSQVITSPESEGWFRPIVLLDAEGHWSQWTDLMPKEWWPARVSDAVLVGCVEGEVNTDLCITGAWSMGGSWDGIRIRVIAPATAGTAYVVGVWNDLHGAKISDRDCIPNVSYGSAPAKTLEKDPLNADDLRRDLNDYVRPDGYVLPLKN